MIKVSILCPTYNQEKYVRQALESFVMQKTNFDFEVIVHDDASTDRTVGVIKEFAEKYPKIIKPIFQSENQFSRGNYGMISKVSIPASKGEYISLCEGDDFFTDKNKLQIQADFLDKNKDCSMCIHPVKVFFENKEEEDAILPDARDVAKFTTNELLRENFIYTNSVMYRRLNYDNLHTNIVPNDWYLHLYHAKFGKIGFINQVMSAYRRHPGSSWWNSYNDPDEIFKKHGIKHLEMYFELLNLFSDNNEFKIIILNHIHYALNRLAGIDQKYGTHLLANARSKFTEGLTSFIISYFDSGKFDDKVINRIGTEKISLRVSKFRKFFNKFLMLKNNGIYLGENDS